MRFVALAAVLLAAASPVAAQRAELLSFTPPAGDLDGTQPAVPADAATADGQTERGLAEGFAALGASPQATVATNASAMPIPLWLQTGIPPSGTGQGAAAYPPSTRLAGGCGATPYRVRGDLPASTEARRFRLYPLISQVACEAGIPVGLFDALVSQESRYNLAALSPKGAMGLTQLMPGTAQALGVVDPWLASANLRGGARYLRQQLDEFGRVDLALAAYNAGPGRVRGRGRIPPISETIGYVRAVTRAWSASLIRTPTLIAVASPPPSLPPARRRGRVAELVAYTFPSVSNPM